MSLESWLQREERKEFGLSWVDGPAPEFVADRVRITDSGGRVIWDTAMPDGPVERDPSGLALNAPGAKADDGKTLAGVLLDFGHALEGVARVGTMGAAKYSRGGWQQVPNGQQRYLDAAMRHLLKHGQGERHDAQSGLTHLSHAAWNLLAIAELDARGGK